VIFTFDVIRIAIPWPPTDQTRRRLNAGLDDRVINGRESEEKN
jgi:hypothetical protein